MTILNVFLEKRLPDSLLDSVVCADNLALVGDLGL